VPSPPYANSEWIGEDAVHVLDYCPRMRTASGWGVCRTEKIEAIQTDLDERIVTW